MVYFLFAILLLYAGNSKITSISWFTYSAGGRKSSGLSFEAFLSTVALAKVEAKKEAC